MDETLSTRHPVRSQIHVSSKKGLRLPWCRLASDATEEYDLFSLGVVCEGRATTARRTFGPRAAVRFLETNDNVDPKRIGVLPICASSGYTVVAVKAEPGIRSIAMVAPWLHNKAIVESFYGGAVGVAERLESSRVARKRFNETGTVEYVKAASNSDQTAAMYWEGDALDYYLNPRRGAIPQWGGRFAVMAWTEWLEFDPIAMAPVVNVPTLLVTGEQTATPGGAKEFASRMIAPHDVVTLETFYQTGNTKLLEVAGGK